MSASEELIFLYDGWFKSVIADYRAHPGLLPENFPAWLEQHRSTLKLIADSMARRADQ